MNNIKRFAQYLIAYVLWIMALLVWAAFIFFSRDVINDLLSLYYYQDKWERIKVIQFFNQFYPFILGLVWLVLMLVIEQYFRNGVKKGDLWYRVARVFAPMVLLLLASNVAQIFVFGISDVPLVYWLIMLGEILLGGALLWLARKGRSQQTPAKPIELR